MDLIDEWSVLLAEKVAQVDLPMATTIVRRYVAGGKSRQKLLYDRGEQTGGFGGGAGASDLVVVLDVLRTAGHSVLSLLNEQAVGNVAGVASLIVSFGQTRRAGFDNATGRDAQATESGAARVERAARDVSDQFIRHGLSQDASDALTVAVLEALVQQPARAAAFLFLLEPPPLEEPPKARPGWFRRLSAQRRQRRRP